MIICVLLLTQVLAVSATVSDAKTDWQDAKAVSKEKQQAHRDAKVDFAANKSDENKQAVIDTGKDSLHAALNEVEAWLTWKNLEAQENTEVPAEIKESIETDVQSNLATIDELRTEVDAVENQLGLGIVFLKMIGKYFELIADVARNTGSMWIFVANEKADTIEQYENKLRTAAEGMDNNDAIIERLDDAKDELESARVNIDQAEGAYAEVKIPGKPLVKFSEGNNNLKAARMNLISATQSLNQAFALIARG